MRGRNSVQRKAVYRPITARDRDHMREQVARLREKINPKQLPFKPNP